MGLKDALLKAGFKSSKTENFRESAKGRPRKQSEIHQHTRSFCEHCSSTQPDVEKYKHRNPTTGAEWICLLCADRLMIADKFRVTEQSDMAKKGMFKREFGETKVFSQHGVSSQSRRPAPKGSREEKKGLKKPRNNSKASGKRPRKS